MPIQTWTRKDWDGFDELCIDAKRFEAQPVDVDDPEGDPMGLSDVEEEEA